MTSTNQSIESKLWKNYGLFREVAGSCCQYIEPHKDYHDFIRWLNINKKKGTTLCYIGKNLELEKDNEKFKELYNIIAQSEYNIYFFKEMITQHISTDKYKHDVNYFAKEIWNKYQLFMALGYSIEYHDTLLDFIHWLEANMKCGNVLRLIGKNLQLKKDNEKFKDFYNMILTSDFNKYFFTDT
jgi:hypothetical protein